MVVLLLVAVFLVAGILLAVLWLIERGDVTSNALEVGSCVIIGLALLLAVAVLAFVPRFDPAWLVIGLVVGLPSLVLTDLFMLGVAWFERNRLARILRSGGELPKNVDRVRLERWAARHLPQEELGVDG